ncbi:MAG: ATP-binding protein [Fusobacteriaceae bacterium]|jgi:hypothetical protein|nr:ATP-binding protein [Fusobacteriaceae bacterium]
MGTYLNPTNELFKMTRDTDPYVDKSGLIAELNRMIHTSNRWVCVSRPRRFGKTTTANMLNAYYGIGNDSAELFEDLAISKDASFEKHLNRYNVIFLDIANFFSKTKSIDKMIQTIIAELTQEFSETYLDIPQSVTSDFTKYLNTIFLKTNISNIVIIDEWDCIFREKTDDSISQNDYLEFLRTLLKDQPYVSLVYMTGILPIKRYVSHSALNMFNEFTMISPKQFDKYVGFTSDEVKALCARFGMDYDEMAAWYNGYSFPNVPEVFNPRSVVAAIQFRSYENYWVQTVSFEALKIYLVMNFGGLRESVVSLLAGERIPIDTSGFTNDMVSFSSKDDVMTLMIHLGYLGFQKNTGEVFIPNKEINDEFITAIKSAKWDVVVKTVSASRELLNATWRKDAKAVAKYITAAHEETSHLTYSDENALSYTISLAYYAARDHYIILREMPAGKDYADMIFLPRNSSLDKPPMVVELKWDKSAEGAVEQIREKKYPSALEGHAGKVLLVGINYDKKTREHTCVIEEYER